MKLRFERGAAVVLSLALLACLATSPASPGWAAARGAQPQDSQTQEGEEPKAEPKPEQRPQPPPRPIRVTGRGDLRLPNGKSQREEILKADFRQNVADARKLAELSQQLRDDLLKSNHGVLSVADLRKTDEIEKLVRKIRDRMRR
jgi:hypothetical protein